jgi:hypothetical protein
MEVLGTLITDSCNTWGIVTLTSYGPTFLKVQHGKIFTYLNKVMVTLNIMDFL